MFNEVVDALTWDDKKGIPNIEERPLVFSQNRRAQYSSLRNYQYLKLDSEAFLAGGMIPFRYTCDGKNVSPPMSISNFPANAKSLAVIVDDPDGINGNFCHWLVWDLPITDLIEEGEHRGVPGRNDFGFYKYNGPCPPVGTHRYYFKVYALDTVLDLPSETGKAELENAMKDHVVGFGFLVGKYHMRL
jgi:Raf kinase inhibitor-like YbhB/YbcL family protein